MAMGHAGLWAILPKFGDFVGCRFVSRRTSAWGTLRDVSKHQPLDVQRVFILAVDPNESIVAEIRAALDPGIPVRWARNEAEALENDRSHRWLGVVVGPTVGDSAGLELLKRLVSHSSADVAAALVASQPTLDQLRDAAQHAITLVFQPINEASLTAFREQCHLRRQPTPGIARKWAARTLSERHELTARESEVLELLLEGGDVGRISERFNISEKTAQHHVSSILRKSGVSRARQLMVRALHIAQAACVDGMPLAELTPQLGVTPEMIENELLRLKREAEGEGEGDD